MMPRSKPRQVIVLGTVSGGVSYCLIELARLIGESSSQGMPMLENAVRYGPGLAFALLVLWPLAELATHRHFRALLAAAGSVLIYYAMVQLAQYVHVERQESPLAACGIAGGLGALLTALLARYVLDRQLSMLAVAMGFVAGSIGGALIGQAILTPEMQNPQAYVVAGFVFWQAGVGFALFVVDPMGVDPVDTWRLGKGVGERDKPGPDELDR
jgi:hypothetical protein